MPTNQKAPAQNVKPHSSALENDLYAIGAWVDGPHVPCNTDMKKEHWLMQDDWSLLQVTDGLKRLNETDMGPLEWFALRSRDQPFSEKLYQISNRGHHGSDGEMAVSHSTHGYPPSMDSGYIHEYNETPSSLLYISSRSSTTKLHLPAMDGDTIYGQRHHL